MRNLKVIPIASCVDFLGLIMDFNIVQIPVTVGDKVGKKLIFKALKESYQIKICLNIMCNFF